MTSGFQDQMVFHLTGSRAGDGLASIDVGALRPALLSRYRDLTRLRYDFPLLLPEATTDREYVHSLSAIVNRVLIELAPCGLAGERLRRHVLRLEREVRTMMAAGVSGSLSALWADAAGRLGTGADETIGQVLAHAGQALKVDGELVDCDARLPERFVAQAWRHVQMQKRRQFHALVDSLLRKLEDIRRAALAHSAAGQQPAALAAAIGVGHAEVFDFAVMSRLVARGAPQDELPARRRARIERILGILRGQPFYPAASGSAAKPAQYTFTFDNCAAAATAYGERLPLVVDVVKAIAIAELESTGAYVEADHDAFFERFDESALNADDLALFPDYLVCIPPGRNDAPENANLIEMLSAGLPVKVLVQQADLLEEFAIGTGHFAFGVRSTRLATTAMGLGGMFVLQATGADLYAMRERIARGVSCPGPALFCVFPGSPVAAGDLPAYLTAAAAKESRTFPAFTYDATGGANWATRFSLENNRNPDADWAVTPFDYADETQQRVDIDLAFTYADFVFCDRRYAAHFAVVPRERWNAGMLALPEWLALPERGAAEKVPFLWAVDAEDRLHRVIVDSRVMQGARRCLLLWHRLQEHGGIRDSHAERLLERERATRDAERQRASGSATAGLATVASATVAAAAVEAAAPAPADGAATADANSATGEPWIETARCPSCNECQTINDRMFGYNDNRQAYIKDATAGTFRQLVEAAEVCQVAIIHPGKPRDPKEPGLDELLKRAQAFQ
jgi:hypothetical protein